MWKNFLVATKIYDLATDRFLPDRLEVRVRVNMQDVKGDYPCLLVLLRNSGPKPFEFFNCFPPGTLAGEPPAE